MIIELLSKKTGLSAKNILDFANSASHKYKSYQIPKNKKGMRTISHPSKELKVLQKILLNEYFNKFPVHCRVMSYVKGKGIKDNAETHSKNNFMLRVDFKNFFPSIHKLDLLYFFKKSDKTLSMNDIKIISKIVCKNMKLTIGAPTSPVISNIIMYKFDTEIASKCEELGVTYTRYADDLYFSTNSPNVLESLYEIITKTLELEGVPNLVINKKKTIFTSRKRKKVITGLVLTSDKKVSLGRDKKRYIKSLVYKFKKSELTPGEIATLRGKLSFAKSVDPIFIISLEKKYGIDLIQKINQV